MQAVAGSTADVNGLLALTAESMDTWCEAASDFAYAQETTAGLFQNSYIGPTSGYGGQGAGAGANGASKQQQQALPYSVTGYNDQGSWTGEYGNMGAGFLPSVFDYQGNDPWHGISFANEGFVPEPTLAMIGDRPGGEYVVGAARFEDFAAKAQGGITININSPVSGAGDAGAFDAILEKRNAELVEQITSKIAQARRGL